MGRTTARRPTWTFAGHAAVASLVRQLAIDGALAGVHDTADGIGVALAEMAVRSQLGFTVEQAGADHAWLFAESPSRVVACVAPAQEAAIIESARSAGVPVTRLGEVGGTRLTVAGVIDVSVDEAVEAWRGRLPAALAGGTTH